MSRLLAKQIDFEAKFGLENLYYGLRNSTKQQM